MGRQNFSLVMITLRMYSHNSIHVPHTVVLTIVTLHVTSLALTSLIICRLCLLTIFMQSLLHLPSTSVFICLYVSSDSPDYTLLTEVMEGKAGYFHIIHTFFSLWRFIFPESFSPWSEPDLFAWPFWVLVGHPWLPSCQHSSPDWLQATGS